MASFPGERGPGDNRRRMLSTVAGRRAVSKGLLTAAHRPKSTLLRGVANRAFAASGRQGGGVLVQVGDLVGGEVAAEHGQLVEQADEVDADVDAGAPEVPVHGDGAALDLADL